MIAIEQEYYRKKLVGGSIDWATINTAIDFYLIVTSQLFVSQKYNTSQQVGVEWMYFPLHRLCR